MKKSAETVKSFSELSLQIAELNQLDKAVRPFLPHLNGPSMLACEQVSEAENNYQGKYLGLWVAMRYVSHYSEKYTNAAYSQSDALGRLNIAGWQSIIDDYNSLVAKYKALVGLARGMASFPASFYPVHAPELLQMAYPRERHFHAQLQLEGCHRRRNGRKGEYRRKVRVSSYA